MGLFNVLRLPVWKDRHNHHSKGKNEKESGGRWRYYSLVIGLPLVLKREISAPQKA